MIRAIQMLLVLVVTATADKVCTEGTGCNEQLTTNSLVQMSNHMMKSQPTETLVTNNHVQSKVASTDGAETKPNELMNQLQDGLKPFHELLRHELLKRPHQDVKQPEDQDDRSLACKEVLTDKVTGGLTHEATLERLWKNCTSFITHSLRSGRTIFQDPLDAFNFLDQDNDGRVTEHELDRSRLLTGLPARVTEYAALGDLDGSGFLNFTEFHTLLTSGGTVRASGTKKGTMILTEGLQKGVVDKLYSFGAPSASQQALENGQSADKCFAGRRVWINKFRLGKSFPDPVAVIFSVLFKHPLMSTLSVPTFDSEGKSIWNECSEEQTRLPWGFPCLDWNACHEPSSYLEVAIHWMKTAQAQDPSRAASLTEMAHAVIAFSNNYNDKEHVAAARARHIGYRMIGRGIIPDQKVDEGDRDVVDLYQHEDTLQCIISFEGAEYFGLHSSDWINNLMFFTGQFCGFPGIHAGFRKELLSILQHKHYIKNIKDKLPYCSSVTVAGQSMGGVLATLFTACANVASPPSTPQSLDEYNLVTWQKKSPKLLPMHSPPKETSCTRMGIKWTPDMPGHIVTQEANQYDCMLRCRRTAGCAHWTYYFYGECSLQGVTAVSTWGSSGADSGPPDCRKAAANVVPNSRYEPLDMPGTKESFESTPTRCQQRCRSTNGCEYFSFGGKWNIRTCHLADRHAIQIPEENVMSGAKDGQEASCFRSGILLTAYEGFGTDKTPKMLNVSSPVACQQQCVANRVCRTFSWKRDKTCYLFDRFMFVKADRNTISGAGDCSKSHELV